MEATQRAVRLFTDRTVTKSDFASPVTGETSAAESGW